MDSGLFLNTFHSIFQLLCELMESGVSTWVVLSEH